MLDHGGVHDHHVISAVQLVRSVRTTSCQELAVWLVVVANVLISTRAATSEPTMARAHRKREQREHRVVVAGSHGERSHRVAAIQNKHTHTPSGREGVITNQPNPNNRAAWSATRLCKTPPPRASLAPMARAGFVFGLLVCSTLALYEEPAGGCGAPPDDDHFPKSRPPRPPPPQPPPPVESDEDDSQAALQRQVHRAVTAATPLPPLRT